MLVKDIMTRDVKATTVDAKIRDVAMIMCFKLRHKVSGLPVVDDNGRIVGIISEKDILNTMFPKLGEYMDGQNLPNFEVSEKDYLDVLNRKVGDLMSKRVTTVPPDMPVLQAASVMSNRQFRRVPVAEHGKLVGIVSIGDVHKAIFQTTLGQFS